LVADNYVEDIATFFQKGQTVFARVEEVVEGDKNLLSLALKPSLTARPNTQFLPSLFVEMV